MATKMGNEPKRMDHEFKSQSVMAQDDETPGTIVIE